ncbi:MerR family transcriptional regulator [Geothermobacter ehrlichii]|uniref:MerR family transcriptional regulator n=1 Tax=Geothermobacter ehrlichii TaxID=213224 RepID=A0A5D3WM78_9BACT|nr:MerR family transcriptional regulator [Geothermobacter ehrlichii]TYP00276.1 MerR family transcriptional regulator [Geothermobacter ehrlichii]
MDTRIPDKLYFRIGEVAELTGIKPHVLRYWESEFKSFKPVKSRSNQRLYRRKDVELVFRLKDLLYEQGYTIAGARKKLKERQPSGKKAVEQLALPLTGAREKVLLRQIHSELSVLRDRLKSPLES